jgi:endoglucanase
MSRPARNTQYLTCDMEALTMHAGSILVLVAIMAAVLASCAQQPSAPATPTVGAAPPTAEPIAAADPFELNKRLTRGVNLGNALEAPNEGEWGVVLQDSYFKLIRDAGFDAVRIPVRWSAHAARAEPYTIDPAFFERIDWAVGQALDHGLIAVVDMHHYDELDQRPRTQETRFLALWKQIAERYRSYPPELVFELYNEPHQGFTAEIWNRLLAEAIAVVRASNPTRAIVVGPVEWYSIGKLRELHLPPDDRRLIVTFHYYNPFSFTHQGAEWIENPPPVGTTWTGQTGQQRQVTSDLDEAARWGDRNHRPLYMGEFGAYSKADMASRARWTAFVAREAEARGISWAYWEFCSGFGIYDKDRGAWRVPLLGALIPRAP